MELCIAINISSKYIIETAANKNLHENRVQSVREKNVHLLISRKSAETLTAVLALVSIKTASCKSA